MMHWTLSYLGQPWSVTHDCFYWFRRVQREVFGRDIDDLRRDGNRLLFSMRAMSDGVAIRFGWRRSVAPVDGDAVYMTQKTKPHHIGVAAVIRGKVHVLHAPDGCGVVLSDQASLRLNLWRVTSYWTPAHEN